MIPLYGFLQGDTIGLLILAYENENIAALSEKLKIAASVRVAPAAGGDLWFEGRLMEPRLLLSDSGLERGAHS